MEESDLGIARMVDRLTLRTKFTS